MLRHIGLRVLYLIPVLFLVTLATFFMLDLVPGDPVTHIVGPDASPQQIAQVRAELGLDEPVFSRYVDWLGGVLQGDFGKSLLPPVQDVSQMISQRLPVTLELALMAMVMSLVIAIPVALAAAFRVERRFDRLANSAALGVISVPSFLTALLLVLFMVFRPEVVRWTFLVLGGVLVLWALWRAVRGARDATQPQERNHELVRWLGLAAAVCVITVLLWSYWPAFPRQVFSRLDSGAGLGANLKHLFLPALTLALAEAAVFMRVLRNDLSTTLTEDFVLFAKAKGMPAWRILLGDALRPSSFSLITVAGVSFGRLIGGTIIVESIFNLPGMGTMIVRAVSSGDFRVVQAGLLVIAVFYVLINSLIDVSYAYLDPRVRRG